MSVCAADEGGGMEQSMKYAVSNGSMPARRVLCTLLAFLLAIYLCIPTSISFADESQAGGEASTESAEPSHSGESGFAGESSESAEASAQEQDADSSAESDAGAADGAAKPEEESSQSADGDGGAAEGESSEAESADGDASEQDTSQSSIDLALLWESGDGTVSAPGTYVLGSDVNAAAPLRVQLAAGEAATIDLAGHDAVVTADSASEDACAIDLSENAGAVTFLDSSADEADWATYSSVALKLENPEGANAVVSDVRSQNTQGTAPSALFEHVSLVVDVAWNSQAEGEDALEGIAVVRTSADDAWQASDVEVPMSFRSCRFGISSSAYGADGEAGEEAQRSVSDALAGKTSLVDAQRRGIKLDGACCVFALADDEDASDAIELPLLSDYDSTYEIGPDFSLANASQQRGALSRLALGFPTKDLAKSADETTVAKAFAGEAIPESTEDVLSAELGYDLHFNAADDGAVGFESLSMAKTASGQAEIAEYGEVVADASAIQPQPEQPEAATASAPIAFLSTSGEEGESGEVDLNEAWNAQEGALESPFTITEGGTYYLSADLEAKSYLVIDAAGENVILKFNGHSLTLDGGGTALHKTMLLIANASSAVLDGAATSGTSSLVSAGEADVWGISCEAADCVVSANDLSVTLRTNSNTQRNLSTHAVRTESGTLALTRCTVHMDMGNQALKSSDLLNDKSPEVPSAVYATSDVESVTMTDCTVIGDGPQGFSLSDVSDTTTIGNAYALYSLAASTIVQGGSYTATSARGSATCLYGTALKVQPSSTSSSVKLEADAAQLASGILSTRAGTVLVDAPLDFSVGESFSGVAQVEAALRSSVDDGFVFGSCVPTEEGARYPVLVLKSADLQAANAQGSVAGTFHADLPQTVRDSVVAALSNALPQGACTLASDSGRAVFMLDTANAVACIDGAAYYSTIKEALEAFSDGSTLALLKDAGAICIDQVSNATLDLNGHAISSLVYRASTAGAGLVVKDGAIQGTAKVNAAQASVYHHSASPLTLSNVAISADVADAAAYGIYAAAGAGTLMLCDQTAVNVKAARLGKTSGVSAYGINMPSKGPELVLDAASISVVTASSGVAVYGLYSSVAATITDSAVSVSGTTATSCGAYIGGTLSAADSAFDVYTSGVASSACGIWARTSTPKAESVSLDTCMVFVRSAAADTSNAAYTCLMGDTSESGTAAPTRAWSLSGANTFRSVGGVHLGLNVGDIQLASDFALSALSESPLVISQSSRTDNVGMTLAADSTEERALELAALFTPKAGSNYEGWQLVPGTTEIFPEDAPEGPSVTIPCLVWRAENDANGQGIVAVVHDGAQTTYASLAAALAAAESGDTVRLLGDLSESGTATISQSDLVLDLDGHALTLRAAAGAKASKPSAGGAVTYKGSGSFEIQNGTLNILAGSVTEPATATAYQGVAVTGGGALTIGEQATVNVSYGGSTSASAVQRSVTLRGVAVTSGSLSLAGTLNVTGAASDGGIGAMATYGVFVEPPSGSQARADIASSASVRVNSATGAIVTKNTYYAEAASGVQSQGGPYGLREITVDPELDPGFYQEIVRQFRISASFDDPNDSTARNTFNASIYYADGMQLEPEDEDAWYYGLKIWAYSDEVAATDVGKVSSMVPTHFFVGSPYDTLPEAYGVASSPSAEGTADVAVRGSVAADCARGNASALQAEAAEGSTVTWLADGAALDAQADESLHLFAGEQFDLRNYIEFSSSQTKKVAYPSATVSKIVRFGFAEARDVVADGNVTFTLDGGESLSVEGGDAANVEASSFHVGSSFKLVGGTASCTVANESGQNAPDEVFALSADGAKLDASLFADAYLACATALDGDGNCIWAEKTGSLVTFKVGDAVVARYASPLVVNLAEPSAAAVRPDDQRQSFSLVGWSQCADENATSGYTASNAIIVPSGDEVYYAVYGTGLTSIPVTFANVHDAEGQLVQTASVSATYGQTVAEALEAADAELPVPDDYVDEARGVTYRFAGWYPANGSSATDPLLYSSQAVLDLEVTLALNGANSGSLTLYAAYVATASDQHLVTFVIDGYSNVCVVSDGERPVYTAANSTNNNYVDPAKQVSETGKTFTFAGWYVDADGDGERGSDETTYRSVLPPAYADATYTAEFSWKWSDVSYAFYIKYYDEQANTLVTNGTKLVSTTYKEAPQDVADSVAEYGSSFGYGGKVYTLKGWATRRTDVDPLYDADNPIPGLDSDSRSLNNTYSTTYYGVYSSADHSVAVTFNDGDEELGAATVLAASTSVNAAFTATGATAPKDRSADEVFVGWATAQDATEAVEGSSTSIESLAPGAQETLALYAVFGKRPTYTVRLRTADGSSVLYSVAVKRGDTVASALVAAGVAVSVPSQEGSYFAGWLTAAGTEYMLDTPVTGSADYYASYADVTVDSFDETDIDATATVSYAASTSASALDSIAGITFTLVSRDAADTPIRTTAAKNSYTILKCYDMRLVATTESGTTSQITGEFGTAQLKVYVGTAYRNGQVRAFWLGDKSGTEAVMNSAVKEVDSDGYITLSIGNFTIGDEDEGGNLAIAYVEGGTSSGTLSSDETESDSSSLTLNGSTSTTLDSSSLSSSLSGSSLSGSSLSGNSLSGSSLSGTLSSGSLSSSSLGSSLSSGGSSTSSLTSTGDSSASLGSSAASSLSTKASGETGATNGKEGGSDDEADGEDAGWGSEAWVLLLVGAGLLAALLRKLWVLFVAKPRRDEEEAEMPAMEEQYAEGIRF